MGRKRTTPNRNNEHMENNPTLKRRKTVMIQIHNDIGRINYGSLLTYAGVMAGFLATVYLMVI
jgi:hypothetical protein